MNESIELAFKEGSSDKVYQAELKEEPSGYVVNFAYGRRGNTLATGTKTAAPVEYATAKKVYDKLVHSKTVKGYKPEGGEDLGIKVVDAKQDTGLRPQLLNEITEEEADKYINDDRWCAQEKNDGRRKIIKYTGTTVQGANKLGFLTPVTGPIEKQVQLIHGACILDSEDMGDYLLIFDELSYPNMRYEDRLIMLEGLIKMNQEELIIVETAYTTREKQMMYEKLRENKAEGIVFKLKDAAYAPGRPNSGGDQLKCKFYESASCIVTSVSDVKRSIGVSVIDDTVPGFYDGLNSYKKTEVGNVTVYPNQDIPRLNDIVEVKYLYYYPKGSLYQPVLLSIREDVDSIECLLSKLKTKQGTDE